MTSPRTISGQAALSGMRPFVRRALAQTIVGIETEAAAPYEAALRAADAVLASLAEQNPAEPWDEPTRADLVRRAEAARREIERTLEP